MPGIPLLVPGAGWEVLAENLLLELLSWMCFRLTAAFLVED